MNLEYRLNEVLRRHNIGYVSLCGIHDSRTWYDKNLEYVVIGVPYRVSHRFQKFWKKAIERFGLGLEVYYIQHGLPMRELISEFETLYFVKRESALKMLMDFYETMIPELED